MKNKITNLKTAWCLLSMALLLASWQPAFAGQVPENDAKRVAENFFRPYTAGTAATARLHHTAFDSQGNPLYYIFNINDNSGFVIISAEDAAQPVIGYSAGQGFEQPALSSAISFWLSGRENEIKLLRQNHVSADAAVSSKWNRYLTAQTAARTTAVTSSSVAPLVSTKWNQSPFYNALCPGGSVTGCVATTMAQIMRYWSYPAQGTGSSSYCDCYSSGFSNNYGTLSANYGASTYNWNNMPLQLTSNNTDVAKLMSDCGISVQMDYSPTGSGAQVLASNSSASAERSFINYFKYDPAAILGVSRSSYSDAIWISMLKHDIDIGRPVQYAGFGNQGGHTWVCDGYDENEFFHMNWGWGGAGDGYFFVDNLNSSSGDFSYMQQAIFGIVPIGSTGADAGITTISPYSNGCLNMQYAPAIKVRNYSSSPLTSFVINYQVDNGPLQTTPWSGSLVTGQAADIALPALTLSNGQHNIKCWVIDPNNSTDVNALNDEANYDFAIYGQGTIPVVQGFETPAQAMNEWHIVPSQNGANWQMTSQAASGGSRSVMIDNLSNTAGNASILQGINNYDFSRVLYPTFYFKVAYQQKSASSNDKLNLEISNDCGKTWWVKWSKQGAALASTSAMSASAFVPAAADFTQYTLPGIVNRNTIFRWVFTADPTAPGNNVYLDDINLGEALNVGINSIDQAASNLEVYPNPTGAAALIRFNLNNAATVAIDVTDIAGRKVIELPAAGYSAGEQLVTVNNDGVLSRGIYMITVTANGVRSSRKLIVD